MHTKYMAHCSTKMICDFFFFNDTATTEIYTLSLHDALPIFHEGQVPQVPLPEDEVRRRRRDGRDLRRGNASVDQQDRKSTRLNSSHANISYAVFCLKKKIYKLPSVFSHHIISISSILDRNIQ